MNKTQKSLITNLLVGKFEENYFTYTLFKGCELRLNADYIYPTEYQFNGIKFLGIPISSAIAGIRQASLNPKRTLDKKMLHDEIKKIKAPACGNINVYFYGISIPYLYDIFSFFSNIYGGVRILFGKKYETW